MECQYYLAARVHIHPNNVLLQNIYARGVQPVICSVLRLRASNWTTPHARPTVLQNGNKVTVGAAAKTVSACAGNNLQLVTWNRLSQDYVCTQLKDTRLLKILLCHQIFQDSLIKIYEWYHTPHFTSLFKYDIYFTKKIFLMNLFVTNLLIN
jgi:hypothetical protein